MLNSLVGIIASSGGAAGGGTSYESIATVTLAVDTADITFSSIAATYSSLQVRALIRGTAPATEASLRVQLNADTATNYAFHNLNGEGTTAAASGSATQSNLFLGYSSSGNSTANIFGVAILDIHDYASTSKYKTLRSFTGHDQNGSGRVALLSGLWQSTSAVNSIKLYPNSGSWKAGTTIALYGIKGA